MFPGTLIQPVKPAIGEKQLKGEVLAKAHLMIGDNLLFRMLYPNPLLPQVQSNFRSFIRYEVTEKIIERYYPKAKDDELSSQQLELIRKREKIDSFFNSLLLKAERTEIKEKEKDRIEKQLLELAEINNNMLSQSELGLEVDSPLHPLNRQSSTIERLVEEEKQRILDSRIEKEQLNKEKESSPIAEENTPVSSQMRPNSPNVKIKEFSEVSDTIEAGSSRTMYY